MKRKRYGGELFEGENGFGGYGRPGLYRENELYWEILSHFQVVPANSGMSGVTSPAHPTVRGHTFPHTTGKFSEPVTALSTALSCLN